MWRYNCGKATTELESTIKCAAAWLGRANLSDANKGLRACGKQSLHVGITPHNPIAGAVRSDFLDQTDQARDREFASSFDDVDAGSRVSAGPNYPD
jgi:hypothetical protein